MTTTIEKPIQKCHSIIVTGKVQDIGFRSIVEHIGRSFGLPGLVFNSKDGSVKILCCGEDSVVDNFTQTIKVRGEESGAKIKGIKEILLPFNIDLPDEFSKVSSDDEIDIGRKLDKGNEFLKNLPEMKDALKNLPDMKDALKNLPEMKDALKNLPDMKETLRSLPDIKDMLGSFIEEQREHNTRLEAHNIRLDAILEKMAEKL